MTARPRTLWLLAVGGAVAVLVANDILNRFYAASQFPVPFARG